MLKKLKKINLFSDNEKSKIWRKNMANLVSSNLMMDFFLFFKKYVNKKELIYNWFYWIEKFVNVDKKEVINKFLNKMKEWWNLTLNIKFLINEKKLDKNNKNNIWNLILNLSDIYSTLILFDLKNNKLNWLEKFELKNNIKFNLKFKTNWFLTNWKNEINYDFTKNDILLIANKNIKFFMKKNYIKLLSVIYDNKIKVNNLINKIDNILFSSFNKNILDKKKINISWNLILFKKINYLFFLLEIFYNNKNYFFLTILYKNIFELLNLIKEISNDKMKIIMKLKNWKKTDLIEFNNIKYSKKWIYNFLINLLKNINNEILKLNTNNKFISENVLNFIDDIYINSNWKINENQLINLLNNLKQNSNTNTNIILEFKIYNKKYIFILDNNNLKYLKYYNFIEKNIERINKNNINSENFFEYYLINELKLNNKIQTNWFNYFLLLKNKDNFIFREIKIIKILVENIFSVNKKVTWIDLENNFAFNSKWNKKYIIKNFDDVETNNITLKWIESYKKFKTYFKKRLRKKLKYYLKDKINKQEIKYIYLTLNNIIWDLYNVLLNSIIFDMKNEKN